MVTPVNAVQHARAESIAQSDIPPTHASRALYRPDIDGLRAVAILPVVLYHAFESAMPGGFIGVDVFFVISGYLITRLIATEIAEDRFSIARFYVRRARRILPALFVVLATTVAIGLAVLLPSELATLGTTLAGTAGFVSNLLFWEDIGYFDQGAFHKPLLHTWSLAVEEQFYLFWPIVLILAARIGIGLRRLVLGIMGTSFALSCWLLLRHEPTAFFWLPPRAWELTLGGALALGFVPAFRTDRSRSHAAIAGLGAIGLGLVLLSEESRFPGWSALLPCLGTALLLHAGDSGTHLVARHLLNRKPMVSIGQLSYSLYLWHWPLLSLASIMSRGAMTATTTIAVVVLSGILAALTWRFVEKPFRVHSEGGTRTPNGWVLVQYATVSVMLLAAGVTLSVSNGLARWAEPEVVRIERARWDLGGIRGCLRWQGGSGPLPGGPCIGGDTTSMRRLVVWGDSHAAAIMPGILEYASERGLAVHQLTMANCPPLLDAAVSDGTSSSPACPAFNQQVIDYISSDSAVSTVLLAARWALYTETQRVGLESGTPVYLVERASDVLSSDRSKEVFGRSLARTIQRIADAGRSIVVFGSIPALGINIPECAARNHRQGAPGVPCALSSSQAKDQLQHTTEVIRQIADRHPNVCTFWPQRVLCDGAGCAGVDGDVIRYADDDHLTVAGARLLAQHFAFERCLDRRSTTIDVGND